MKIAATPRVKNIYYVCVALMGIFFIISGLLEITKNPATYPKTLSMGYPPYFITTLGIAKIIGAIALWQPYFSRLKEWAFAGFTFDVIFAFISGIQINSLTECLKSGSAFVLIILIYILYGVVDQKMRPLKKI